jgi:hypothetical protein
MSEHLRASFAALKAFIRSLPLVAAAAPQTLLRVLCIVALDAVHERRHARGMGRDRRRTTAAFLDFAACVNAEWDHKPFCRERHEGSRRELTRAGLTPFIDDYLVRIEELERGRPAVADAGGGFDDVKMYRERVAALSLAAAVAIALGVPSLDDGLSEAECDADVNTLLRLVMQCQIVDDVLDCRQDLAAGLPSFATATPSGHECLRLTAAAVRSYASGSRGAVPFRAALAAASLLASFVVQAAHIRRWRAPRLSADLPAEQLRPAARS